MKTSKPEQDQDRVWTREELTLLPDEKLLQIVHERVCQNPSCRPERSPEGAGGMLRWLKQAAILATNPNPTEASDGTE